MLLFLIELDCELPSDERLGDLFTFLLMILDDWLMSQCRCSSAVRVATVRSGGQSSEAFLRMITTNSHGHTPGTIK